MNRLIQSIGDNILPNDNIFSDEVIRINSNQERKSRILLITKTRFFILIHDTKSVYSIKNHYLLHDIYKVEVAQKNSLLINVTFNNL